MSTPAIEIDLVVPTPNVAQVRSPKIGLAHFLRTDAGNAELFAHLYGDRVRYDHLQSRWLIWDIDRKRWTVDTARHVRTLAIEAARRRLRAAQELATTDDDENPRHKREMAWALKSESRLFLDAMLELAKSMPKVSDPGTKWDTDPFVLGVANGLVDLRTGRLRDERPDDRIVKHSSVRFDPHATCPLFEQFLKTIFPANPEMPIYVQKMMGYTLTGDISEHRIFCHFGRGSNGKSTLLEIIRLLLGDYAVNLPFSALEHARYGNSSTHELVPLHGARFATSSETNDGVRFNEARVKALSGGDPITARRLYQNSFTFEPTHKLWLAFNHRPIVTDDTPGFWRRIDLIEYSKEFSGSEKDESFLAKLKNEAPGILAFAVRGCLLWAAEGLERPAVVAAATAGYQQDTDLLTEFVAECCLLDPAKTVTSAVLWSSYQRWSKDNGEVCLPRRTFIERLAKQFKLSSDRSGHGGIRVWAGIALQLGQ